LGCHGLRACLPGRILEAAEIQHEQHRKANLDRTTAERPVPALARAHYCSCFETRLSLPQKPLVAVGEAPTASQMVDVSSILLSFVADMMRSCQGKQFLPATPRGGYRFFRRLALFPSERLVLGSGRFSRPDDVPVFRAGFRCAAACGSC